MIFSSTMMMMLWSNWARHHQEMESDQHFRNFGPDSLLGAAPRDTSARIGRVIGRGKRGHGPPHRERHPDWGETHLDWGKTDILKKCQTPQKGGGTQHNSIRKDGRLEWKTHWWRRDTRKDPRLGGGGGRHSESEKMILNHREVADTNKVHLKNKIKKVAHKDAKSLF